MGVRLRSFIIGLVIGAIIAFIFGANYGADRPWLSNPFEKRDISRTMKDKTESLLEGAREKLHDATKPDPAKPDAPKR